VAEKLEHLNNRVMRKLGKSRRQLFEEIERAALKPLPARPYELAVWTRPRVAFDYHLGVDGHYYSVHYSLVGERLDVRAAEATIEIFRQGVRIESYERSYVKGGYTTRKEHMPRAHLDAVDWTPERLIEWGKKIGPKTGAFLEAVLACKIHPQQAFKRCRGVLALARSYPPERLERACARALHFRTLTYVSVEAILRNKRDQEPLPGEEDKQRSLPLHENVRGSRYYLN